MNNFCILITSFNTDKSVKSKIYVTQLFIFYDIREYQCEIKHLMKELKWSFSIFKVNKIVSSLYICIFNNIPKIHVENHKFPLQEGINICSLKVIIYWLSCKRSVSDICLSEIIQYASITIPISSKIQNIVFNQYITLEFPVNIQSVK